MEFGKVESSLLNQIDLSLPADDPRSWVTLAQTDGSLTKASLRIGVGAPVWGVKDWLGKVYPVGTNPKDFLEHYARQFNSIELNTTHYRIPDEDTIRRWRETTPVGFKFNPKFLQEISHRHPLRVRRELTGEFITRVMGLEDRLGLSFLQLPPTFSPADLPDLAKFLEQIPNDFQLAVEVRHPSLFDDHRLVTPLFDLMARTKTHAVITDVAGRRDVLHLSLPTDRVLIRFIGNDLHPTDEQRIEEWAQRIKTWIGLGLKQVELFVHQPEDRNAPELINFLIERLIQLLNDKANLSLTTWKPMNQGTQLGFF